MCTVSLKHLTFLSKRFSWPLCFEVTQFLQKNVYSTPVLSKKSTCHLFGRNSICLTGTKVESAASFESYTMIWKYETILSITPFLCKYITVLSKNSSCVLLGQEHHLFEGTVFFTKSNLHPQRIYTWKGKLHIPKEILRIFSIQDFVRNDLIRMPCGQDESDMVWMNLD